MDNIKFCVIPDCHIPNEDKPAMETALKIIQWYKPHTIVILGDFLDCTPVSHWLKENKRYRTKEGLRLKDDYDRANKLLDKITIPSVKHLVYINGNHEDWINDAIESQPELDGLINLDIGLKFKERRERGLKLTHLEYGEFFNLGKLWLTHGTYTGTHHAKKHVESYGRSIVYGHLHDVQLYVKVCPIDIEDKHLGLSLGCLANKNPQFMENRPNNWVHAVGVGFLRKDGTFNIDPIIISNGKATYAGKTFSSSSSSSHIHS